MSTEALRAITGQMEAMLDNVRQLSAEVRVLAIERELRTLAAEIEAEEG